MLGKHIIINFEQELINLGTGISLTLKSSFKISKLMIFKGINFGKYFAHLLFNKPKLKKYMAPNKKLEVESIENVNQYSIYTHPPSFF